MMLRTELVHFKRIPGLSSTHFEGLYRAVVQSALEQDDNEGFINVERTEDSFSALLVLKRQVLHTVFVEGRLLEQPVVYYQRIPFTVDLHHNTIEVFAGTQKANKVASVIGRMLDFQYPIEDVFFAPGEVYRALADAGYHLEIAQLFIRNFHPMQGVSGRFSPTITEASRGLLLLEECEKEVTDAVCRIESPDRTESTLRVSIAGGLTIRAESEEVDSVLEALKEILLYERGTHA